MRQRFRKLAILALTTHLVGCSVLNESGFTPDSVMKLAADKRADRENSNGDLAGKVANPPAKTLRFDGHEIVLGESEHAGLDVDRFVVMLEPLIFQQRMQSAAAIILRHPETGERLLAERWGSHADDAVVQFVAEVLSRRTTNAESSYKSLLAAARSQRAAATAYQSLRNSFADELRSNEPSGEASEKLLQSSLKLAHPLVRIDALRLLGLKELVAGRNAWAESQFRQAIELATASGNNLMAAELWLTVAEAARRSNQMSTANTAWSNAINLHLTANKNAPQLDTSFWLLADKTKSEAVVWPTEVTAALGRFLQPTGCTADGSTEMVLWAAIAQSQFQRGEMQVALVNFKRAETLSSGNNALWLRIAQAKCLAGMSQAPAASAILSGPAASPDPAISAAATAAMGSIKLQSGAYQQGAQLLLKALEQHSTAQWPGRNQAMADLAVAQLIFGDTDSGLSSLHEAEQQLEKAGERTLLVQALDNEVRLLEHENRRNQIDSIKAKILQLEKW